MSLFRCGLRADCPFDVLHLAGREFVKRSERVSGFGTDTRRDAVPGTTHDLSEAQVKAIAEAAKRKVIRSQITAKGGVRGTLLDSSDRHYRKVEGDRPVSEWAYMEPVEASPFAEHTPPTLAQSAAPAKGGK